MLDQLSQALSALAPQADFSVIPLHNPRRDADAQIYYRGGEGWESPDAAKLAAVREALTALPDVAVVGTRGDSLTVRFTDARDRAARRAAGGRRRETCWTPTSCSRASEVIVNFCDANPTKALHIGHLRNIALGQALAGTLGRRARR